MSFNIVNKIIRIIERNINQTFNMLNQFITNMRFIFWQYRDDDSAFIHESTAFVVTISHWIFAFCRHQPVILLHRSWTNRMIMLHYQCDICGFQHHWFYLRSSWNEENWTWSLVNPTILIDSQKFVSYTFNTRM